MKRFIIAGAVFAWVCLEAWGAALQIDGTALLRSQHRDLIPAADSAPQDAPVRQVGSQLLFYAYDFPQALHYQVPSTLRAVGDHCYVYVEDSEWDEGRVSQADADAALSAFEKRTPSDAARGAYQILTEAFGSPPDIDGEPRIVLLLLDIRDWHTGPGSGYISGYFSSLNQTRQPDSNETEMLYIDANPQDLSDPESFANAAHEFQHLLHTARDWDEEHWLNEGMSGLAEALCGYDISLHINAFQNDPSGSLTSWPENAARLADYGRAYLWTLYLYERYGGIATIQEIVRNPKNGMPTVDAALRNLGVQATASNVYLDWIAALAADDSRHEDGRYSIQIADIKASPTRAHFQYPTDETSGVLQGWEAQHLEFHPPADGAGSLLIEIDAPMDLKARALLFDGGRLADVRNIDMINGFGEAYDRVVVALGYHPQSEQESETVSYAYSARVSVTDEDRPTVTITGPTAVQRGAFQIDIAFNEDVVGFERSDLAVVNGTAVGFSGARDTYRASIDPIGSGEVQVSVPENAAHDLAGNGNTASNVFSVEARKVAQLLIVAGVLQNSDGTPAPGLKVSFQNVTTQADAVFAPDPTDAQGRYSLTLFHLNGVVESGQTIAARAYADVNGTQTLVGEVERVITDADIDAASIQVNIQVNIPKPRLPAFVLSGVAADMDGSPAEGVTVEGVNSTTVSDAFTAGPTDASGAYTLTFFDPNGIVGAGETLTVRAYADVNGTKTLVGEASHVITEEEIDAAAAQLNIQVDIPAPRPPAFVLSGVVSDMDGSPAEGVTIEGENASTKSDVFAANPTDAAGAYTLTFSDENGVVGAGETLTVRAYADVNGTKTLVGEASHVVTEEEIDAAAAQLNIQVDIPAPRPPSFVLSGVVSDMDESPAEGVMMEGENASTKSDVFAASPTDASGAYTLTLSDENGVVGAGETLTVRAYADVNGTKTLVGEASHVITEEEIDAAAAQLNIQVDIPAPRPPAFVLSGVVSNMDESPAEGVTIEGENATTKSDTFAANPTDAAGAYTLTLSDENGVVGAGETLTVRAYADVNGTKTLVGEASHVITEEEIDAAAAQLNIQVDIPAPRPPAFVLSGIVSNMDESPAEGVTVEGINETTNSVTFTAANPTDASGNYALTLSDENGVVGAGETLAVRAYADVNGTKTLVGEASHVVTEEEIDAAAAELNIQVDIPAPRPPSFVLSGVVSDMDGSPAAGVTVEGENETTKSDTFAANPTDAAGAYTLTLSDENGVVGAGETLAVRAYADVNGTKTLVGEASHVVTEEEIDAAAAQLNIQVDIPKPPADFALSGAAFTLDGIPAPGFHITAQNATAQTEEFEADAPTDAAGMYAAALTGTAVEAGDALIVRAYEIVDGERTLAAERTHTATQAEAETSKASVDLTIQRLAHGGAVLSTAFSPDGRLFATGGADRTPRIWQVQPRRLLLSLTGHTGSAAAVAFSPDGQTLVSGSYDGSARIWDVQTGALVRELQGHTDRVYAAAFSPDGQTLATGSADRTIKLWRASDGKLMKTMTAHAGAVLAVAFSPDGQTIASGSADRTLKVWSGGGQLIYSQKRHGRAVRSAAFSPDGQTIATGSSDETIRFWNAADGRHLLTVGGGGTGLVHSVAFSPDGQTLASAHHDGSVWLWAAGNGRRKRLLEGHTGTVYTLAFSPDGQTLLSGSRDRTFRFWHTPPPRVDVNGDGAVDFADLALAAAQYGQTENITADVNGDGVVDILDILLIADAIDQAAGWLAAPPAHASAAFSSAYEGEAARWFADAERLVVKGSATRRGEAALRSLWAHAVSLPARSSLLPNYPNPFNPETWIPFELSEASHVRLTIYSADGAVAREMDLGELPAGAYRSKAKAAYWDGRNNLGERAASGTYFVRIEAGGYTALRRMVLLK